jgi:hypothetical protein
MKWVEVVEGLLQGIFWFAIIALIVYACNDQLPTLENDCQCVEPEQ